MQKTIFLSTAEAEYYAASEMAIEVIYLRNLLENMGFPQAPAPPCTRTTQSASNGATMSSGDVNAPSILISASILRMKPSKIG